MKKISSRSLIFAKIFGFSWFGVLALIAIMSIRAGALEKPLFLACLALMGIFGYFWMNRTVWSLMDEVLDGDDFLIVKKGGIEERVPIIDIADVHEVRYARPPRVVLTLVAPGRFGSKIAFCPRNPFFLMQSSESSVAEELTERVKQAKSSR
jgi:hypothetical protein